MKNQQTGLVLLLSVVVAIAIAGLAYVFLISPEIDKASTAREDAQYAADQNDLLEIKIAQMQALEKEVPTWREDIARVALDLPATPEESDLTRLVRTQLEDAGVPLVDLTVGQATVIDPLASDGSDLPTLETEEEAAEDGAEASPTPTPSPSASTEASDAGGDASADTAAVAPFQGLYGIPVAFTSEGSPAELLAVLNDMSSQLDRFFTVSGLTITTAGENEEQPGRPALTTDDWTVQVTGLVFSLWSDDRSVTMDEEGEPPVYSGSTATNPFAPLPGTEDSSSSGD
ncbi:hypothetical protein [Demequina sp. NBRC 110057]|uniref:hypothetical protein n=1 Tax=Demequina sp. NBRC 110057 TaxID=1570346 RepID=UPI0009FC5549|nr:hypothetical protein [Demequina sp. NBRC 110057]